MLDPNPTTPGIRPISSNQTLERQRLVPSEDFHSLEILGSVPVWGLTGLRLERLGIRRISEGWEVGVYRMGLAMDGDSDFFDGQESSTL